MLTRKLLMVLGGALLIPQVVSRAEVLTFAMEGPITFKDDRLGLLDFAEVGQRVVYTFTFDTEAEDGNPTPSLGRYVGLSGSFRVGEATFVGSAPVIMVQEHNLFDILCTMEIGGRSANLLLRLSDLDNVAIPTPALPAVPYDLILFENKYFSSYMDVVPPVPPDVHFTRLAFGGAIDRFYVVPEPACAVLVCLGLAGVFRRRR